MQFFAILASAASAVAFLSLLFLGLSEVSSVALPALVQSVLAHAFVISLVIGLLTGGPAFLVGRR